MLRHCPVSSAVLLWGTNTFLARLGSGRGETRHGCCGTFGDNYTSEWRDGSIIGS